MDSADGGRRGVIEVAAPARLPRLVETVRQVRRHRIETGSGPLADDVDDDRGADEPANLITGSHPSVLHDDIGLPDVAPLRGKQPAERRQQRTKLLIDGV